MIRLDTKTESISTQFTGARTRTLGYRKFEKILGRFPQMHGLTLLLLGKREMSGQLCAGWWPCTRCRSQSRLRKISLGRYQISLEQLLCHKVRQCSENTGGRSKRHRSQCEGAPSGQIEVMLMPRNCLPQAGWFLSVFGQ